MKKLSCLLFFSLIIFSAELFAQGEPGFWKNQGQLQRTDSTSASEVKHYTASGDKGYFVQGDRVSWVANDFDAITKKNTCHRLDIRFLNKNLSSAPAGYDSMAYANYYLPHISGGVTNSPIHKKLVFANLYNGIDLRLSHYQGLRYEYEIRTTGSYGAIRMQVDGANTMALNGNGTLTLRTSVDTFTWKRPEAYQMINGVKTTVTASFGLSSNVLYFNIGTYNVTFPLFIVIDEMPPFPSGTTVSQRWSTYLKGPSLQDEALDIWMDANNNLYVTGMTTSALFPAQNGQTTSYSGQGDAFAFKFNANRGIVWGTFYGGSDYDEGIAIAANASGEVYFTGVTTSADFPTCATCTASPQLKNGTIGGGPDVFIVKFTAGGTINFNLGSFATLIGGGGAEEPHSLTVSPNGNVYIGGVLDAGSFTTFPYVASAQGYNQPHNQYPGDNENGFILRISPANNLVWATSIGGQQTLSGALGEEVTGMYADDNYNLWVVGSTPCLGTISGFNQVLPSPFPSVGYPSTSTQGFFPLVSVGGPFVRDNSGGTDMFILKINTKDQIVWSTLFGGQQDELFIQDAHNNNGVSVDEQGNIFITGSTKSNLAGLNAPNFPVLNPYGGAYFDNSFNGGTWDGYIARFNPALQLVWSTYFGSNRDDYAMGISAKGGQVYTTGWITRSNTAQTVTFPLKTLTNSYNQSTFGGTQEAFIASFSQTGVQDYTTYFGGSGNDRAYNIVHDPNLNEFVITGKSSSVNFPFQDIPGTLDYYYDISAGQDAFVSNLYKACNGCQRLANPDLADLPDLLIYPNPADGMITLQNDTREYIETIEVLNLTGQLVRTYPVAAVWAEIHLDVSDLPAGMYILRTSPLGLTTKLIKQN